MPYQAAAPGVRSQLDPGGEPVHVVDIAERLQDGQAGLRFRGIAQDQAALDTAPIRSQIASAFVSSVASP
jgi:hypothetical protein